MHVNSGLKQKICAAVKAPPDIHMKHARVELPAKNIRKCSGPSSAFENSERVACCLLCMRWKISCTRCRGQVCGHRTGIGTLVRVSKRSSFVRKESGCVCSIVYDLRIALHLTMTVVNLFDSRPRKGQQRTLSFGVDPFRLVFPCTLMHRTGYS